MRALACIVAASLASLPSVASADDDPAPAPVTEPPPVEPPTIEPVPAQPLTLTPSAPIAPPAPTGEIARVPWTQVPGRGLAIGYENGLWGNVFMQALRFRIPFSPHWGMMVKGFITHPTDHTGNIHPHYGGGRLDLFGGSPIIAGFARMYGGGGIHVATKVLGHGGDTDVHTGGGGYFGFEFFMMPKLSWIAEIGGGSGVDGSAAGATVVGGMNWYPGS
ncbi:MAG: hypothetical protein KF819_06685 [Labilithrix sp.]|nr:hypothetical protein [Labilithrix sp.]